MAYAAFGWVRVGVIYKYLVEVIDAVSEAAQDDIDQGYDFRWRYDAIRVKDCYRRMMVVFWRPVETFHPNKAFMTRGCRGPDDIV